MDCVYWFLMIAELNCSDDNDINEEILTLGTGLISVDIASGCNSLLALLAASLRPDKWNSTPTLKQTNDKCKHR